MRSGACVSILHARMRGRVSPTSPCRGEQTDHVGPSGRTTGRDGDTTLWLPLHGIAACMDGKVHVMYPRAGVELEGWGLRCSRECGLRCTSGLREGGCVSG
jgi:hypothetical protein